MPFDAIRRWFLRLLRRRRGRSRAGPSGGGGGSGRSGKKSTKGRERPTSALGTFGTRMGRHASIYGGGQGGALLLNLITLAVLTRFLEPAAFGQYALYYVFANLLSVIYALGWVRGSLIWVFGGKGGGDEDDDDDDEGALGPYDPEATANDKRAALGTAIAFIALISGVGTVIVAALAGPLSSVVAGGGASVTLTLLAALAGATGAVWILAAAIPRRERRPKTYVLASLSRPVLVLVATVAIVTVDPTVEGMVLGLAIGTVASALVALLLIRNSFRFAFKGSDVREIARAGLRYSPLILAFFVIANGGVLLLGQYVPEEEVGLFRVASGLAAIASVPMGAAVAAWGPLRREPLHRAVEAERGKLAVSGLLATYFIIVAIWILLTLAVAADLMVMVAPGSYGEAAPLIPLIGLGLLLYGIFRVIRRSSSIPRKGDWYIGLAVVSAVVFVVACLLLIPPFGTYGAALAVVCAFLFGTLGMFARSQLGKEPIPFAYVRLLGALAIAGACYAVATLIGDLPGPLESVGHAAIVLAYPVLLVLAGVVPRAHVLPLRRVARSALPGRSPSMNGRVELNGLDDVHRAVLELLIRHRRPVDDVAAFGRVGTEDLEVSFVEGLREVAGVKATSEPNPRLGAYLLSSAPAAARDQVWKQLAAGGADPLEVDALSLTLKRLRRSPAATWRER